LIKTRTYPTTGAILTTTRTGVTAVNRQTRAPKREKTTIGAMLATRRSQIGNIVINKKGKSLSRPH